MHKLYNLVKELFYKGMFLIWKRTNRAPRSKGEKEVAEYLEAHRYVYKRELNLKCDADFQRNIYIDFYLPISNTYIEYNGKQHYQPVAYFGGQEQFERQQKRDAWVREYCKKKGIRLIEIPYYADVKTYLNVTL